MDFAYGGTRYDAGGQLTLYRYTGQRIETGTGLYDYGARWYDPIAMNTVDLSEWDLTLDWNLFHYSDCLSNPAPVLRLIEVAQDTFSHLPMNLDMTANRIGSFRLRKLKPTPRNWSKVQSEIQKGQVSTLVFGSIGPGEDMRLLIAFQMYNELERKQPSSRIWFHDDVSLIVSDTLIRSGTVDLEMCRTLIREAWVELEGVYAFADMFVTHRTGRVSPWKISTAARALRAKPGSFNVQSPALDLRFHVPDAYWLNFLNATHLQALGGEPNLQSRLPNADVSPLPYSGASIQLSPAPVYNNVEQWEADHWQLQEVLAPLIVERQ